MISTLCRKSFPILEKHCCVEQYVTVPKVANCRQAILSGGSRPRCPRVDLKSFSSHCISRKISTFNHPCKWELSASTTPVSPLAKDSADDDIWFQKLSPEFSDVQIGKMKHFIEVLLEVNKSMNLTAVRDPEEAFERHVCDSLAVLPVLDAVVAQVTTEEEGEHKARVLDVGSGGGLPGVILAIARPEWEVSMLDSLRKRINFINTACDTVDVGNTAGVWARAELAGQDDQHRQRYGVVTARAVAEMRVLVELCLPLVKPGGFLVAYKGADPEDEIEDALRAIRLMGGKLVRIDRVNSEAPEGNRTAVIVKKVSPTPSKYPRQPGTPKKKPL